MRSFTRQSVEDRFWSKVERRGFDDCWLWSAPSVHPFGYGMFTLLEGQLDSDRKRMVGAHRVAFRLVTGNWPDPQALHGCDHPACCNAENPAHIHEGTQALNTLEMNLRGRHAHGYGAPQQGELNRNAKLSDLQIQELLVRRGESQHKLALEYGISQSHVSRLMNGLRRVST